MDIFSNKPGARARMETIERLTAKQVAAQLRVTTRTLRKWIQAGRLKCWRCGRARFFTLAQVRAFLRSGRSVYPPDQADE